MDAAAVGMLGRTLHAWEQWDAAHEAYARCQALAPRVFEWHYLDGLVLQRLARHASAAERFARAAEIEPDHQPVRVRLADALFDAGDMEASEAAFRGVLDVRESEGFARFGLGRIAAARGEHAAAIPHLERAIVAFPDWGAAHYALALSYRAVGRRVDAELALARHARFGARWPALDNPVEHSVAALRDDAVAQLRVGLRRAESGDLKGAIAAHLAALERNPSLAQAHANLVSLYGRVQEWASAEAHYRQAVALGYSLDEAHYNYGVLLGMQERWADAAAAYREAITVNPQHSHAHNNLGQVLERQGQIEAAAEAYREAASSQPLFRLARFNHGRMLLALGRTAAAIDELEKLVEARDAESPLYLYALGTAYVRAGRVADARARMREAHQLASEHKQDAMVDAIERALAAMP